jgi:hypothetical protein
MENVTFDSVYYGTKQQEIFCSKDLSPEEYTGKVLNMFGNSSGNITIKNLVVDKVNTVFEVSGDLDVKVEGYACGCALKTAVLDGGKVTVDGEEIENG